MKKVEKISSTWFPPDTISGKEADVFDHKNKDRVAWLNPIAMSQLQTAVKAKKTTVVLNGLKFNITYGIMQRSSIVEDYEVLKLKRTDGVMAPFGYVRLSKVLAFDFEAAEK